MVFRYKIILYFALFLSSCHKPSQSAGVLGTSEGRLEQTIKTKICGQSLVRLEKFVYQSLSLYLDPKIKGDEELKDLLYNMAIDSRIVPDFRDFHRVLEKYPHWSIVSGDWRYFIFDKNRIKDPVNLRVYLKPKNVESWKEIAKNIFSNKNIMKAFTVGKHIDFAMKEKEKFERRDYICLSFDTSKTNVFELLLTIDQATQGRVISEEAPIGLMLNEGTSLLPVAHDITKSSPTEVVIAEMVAAFEKNMLVKDPCMNLDTRLAIVREVTKMISEKFLTMPFCKN